MKQRHRRKLVKPPIRVTYVLYTWCGLTNTLRPIKVTINKFW